LVIVNARFALSGLESRSGPNALAVEGCAGRLGDPGDEAVGLTLRV
jgi:hypothetical protein